MINNDNNIIIMIDGVQDIAIFFHNYYSVLNLSYHKFRLTTQRYELHNYRYLWYRNNN